MTLLEAIIKEFITCETARLEREPPSEFHLGQLTMLHQVTEVFLVYLQEKYAKTTKPC